VFVGFLISTRTRILNGVSGDPEGERGNLPTTEQSRIELYFTLELTTSHGWMQIIRWNLKGGRLAGEWWMNENP